MSRENSVNTVGFLDTKVHTGFPLSLQRPRSSASLCLETAAYLDQYLLSPEGAESTVKNPFALSLACPANYSWTLLFSACTLRPPADLDGAGVSSPTIPQEPPPFGMPSRPLEEILTEGVLPVPGTPSDGQVSQGAPRLNISQVASAIFTSTSLFVATLACQYASIVQVLRTLEPDAAQALESLCGAYMYLSFAGLGSGTLLPTREGRYFPERDPQLPPTVVSRLSRYARFVGHSSVLHEALAEMCSSLAADEGESSPTFSSPFSSPTRRFRKGSGSGASIFSPLNPALPLPFKPSALSIHTDRITAVTGYLPLCRLLLQVGNLVDTCLLSEGGESSAGPQASLRTVAADLIRAARILADVILQRVVVTYTSLHGITESSVVSAIEKAKWEIKSSGSVVLYPSPFLESLFRELAGVPEKLAALGRLPHLSGLRPRLWLAVEWTLWHAFVEGFSRVKKCTDTGRAQMGLDIRTVEKELQRISGFPCGENSRDYTNGFIQAWFLLHDPETGGPHFVAWLAKHPEWYTARQVSGLLSSRLKKRPAWKFCRCPRGFWLPGASWRTAAGSFG